MAQLGKDSHIEGLNIYDEFQKNNDKIGVLSDLSTTDKSSLTGAINEHSSEIGILSNLSTADKSSLTNAVNENVSQLAHTASMNGLSSTSYTTLQEAIDDAVLKGEALVISGEHTLDSEVLDITSPITIVLANNAFFYQTEYAYPVFYVQSAGVKFYGKLRAENLGTAYHVTSTEVANRGLTIGTNDEKAYSAVICCRQNVDNLYVEHVEGENFISTMTFAHSTSDDTNYSNNVKVDYVRGVRQWQSVLGGGFKSARFGEIIGEDMVWSQGENPNHVLYIGTRSAAPDHYIYVNRVIGYNSSDMSYIAQIKTAKEFVCNEVIGYNCPRSIHTSECQNAKIGSVKGVYTSDTTHRDSVLKVADGSNCVIDTVDITSSEVHDSTNLPSASGISSVGTDTELEILQVNIKMTAASNPMRAIRTSSILKMHKVHVEYSIAPSINPIECSTAEVYIYEPPIIKGTGGLVFTGTDVIDYHLALNPNLVEGEMSASTVTMNDNNFSKLHFKGFDKNPPEWTAASTSYRLRSINVLKMIDGGFTVDTLNYGSEMQEYILLKGSDGTCPALAHGTGNLFFKSGANYTANSWDMIKLLSVGGNLYEV